MWRVPTEADLAATLSQRELDAYRKSWSGDGEDPVLALLAQTGEQVRAYIRANNAVRMSPVAGSIPDALIRPAMAIAAFDILKRFPSPVGEDRRQAKTDALELLDKVAAGTVTPESDGEPDTSSNRAGPAWDESVRRTSD